MKPKKKHNLLKILSNQNFWIITIFTTALIFRLSFLNLIEFKGDEMAATNEITNFYLHPHPILVGKYTSTGWHNFPLFIYLVIALSLFSKNPQNLSYMIALINTYMILLFFLIINKYYGLKTAIFSSLILSLSPWAILFSRKIWEPDLIPLLSIPYLYFLHELILSKKRLAVLPLFSCLVLLIQIHDSGVYLTAATILTLYILKIQWKKTLACLGSLIGMLPAIPYLIFQLLSTPFCPDCIAFKNYQHTTKLFDTINFLRPFQIISTSSFNQILGDSYLKFLQSSSIVRLTEMLLPLECLILICSCYFIIRYGKRYLFLPLIGSLIPILYYITEVSSNMHYFIIILPILALIYGLFFTQALKITKKPLQRATLITLFILLILCKTIFEGNFNHFLSVEKKIKGDYGTIYSAQNSK